MFVHRSNRTEELTAALADVVREPLASVLSAEVIVVSSQGMERWLAQELATRLGVWANASFPFPRTFIDELLEAGDAVDGNADSVTPGGLRWTIADLLPRIAGRPGAEALASHLTGDEHSLKLFELSGQIADVFDQYAVYRPELVRAWERGAGRGWQPDLWRAVVRRHGSAHIATRAARFLASTVPAGAPSRISVFGASTLPRIYVRLLAHLSREREVHIFLLCPATDRSGEHPLAASLGTLGRDFEHILLEEAPNAVFRDRFVEPGARTVLQVLQSDILARRKRATDSSIPRAVARTGDASITVHSCHGPMREVEILRDQLLAMFEEDSTLEPHDVIVMAPNIDDYAPLIDAVFAVTSGEPGFIPYRVADQRIRASNVVAEALLRLLHLAGGRMKASEVLDLLQLEPVREHFGIEAELLAEVRHLVQISGIRWGIDGPHRATFGQPDREENTWRFGLRRLLLGQVMPKEDEPFHGFVPVTTGGVDTAELIGRVSEFATKLFEWKNTLSMPRTVADWGRVLRELLDAFVSSEDVHLAAVRAMRRSIESICKEAATGGFEAELSRETIALVFRDGIGAERGARSFLAGGVTFCALLPMRSIPFRVVCILGLNDTAFPRRDQTPAFDLVLHQPEPGDRSSREEDRQLFLEALLSARDRLLISYVGRAIHDNAALPPSVVVAEVLDLLDVTFSNARETKTQLSLSFESAHTAPDGIGRRAVVEHPLQAFSQRYFGASPDPRLFSHDEADAEGARALAAFETTKPSFHVAPLLAAETGAVDVDELVRFLENPSRGLIQKRLGVFLEDQPLLVSDREPIELDPLGSYEVGARLFAEALQGRDPRSAWARGLGLLPLGAPGDLDGARVVEEVLALFGEARPWLEGGRSAPIEVAVPLVGTTLSGVLRDVYPRAQVFARFVRLKARNELSAWVRHLALSATAATAAPRASVVIGRGSRERGAHADVRVFDPLTADEARRHLAKLVHFYALGQQAPLSLFPAASLRYADVWLASEGRADRASVALDAARKVYEDGRGALADSDDAYVRRLFEYENPIDATAVPFDVDGTLGLPRFGDLALAIFEPLLTRSKRGPA